MRTRTLLNGKKLKELNGKKEETWKMGSLCPNKYLIVDCETGDLWVRHSGKWHQPTPTLIEAAMVALEINDNGGLRDPDRCMVCKHRSTMSHTRTPCNSCSSWSNYQYEKKGKP